jgi:hypothetical protein
MNRRPSARVARAVTAIVLAALPTPLSPAELPIDAIEIMRRVNDRPRGDSSHMLMEMTIHDPRRGDFQKLVDVARKRFGSSYRTAYRIDAPDHEKGLGLLLSEDPLERGMWMYFPATRKSVPVASRGFPAMATDFNCEDLLVSVELKDFEFRVLGRDRVNEFRAILVEMKPRNDAVRNELGFSRAVGWVREDIWLIARADYYDESGSLFKTFRAEQAERVEGIWTPRRMSMENHRIQHRTDVRIAQVDYSSRFADESFEANRMGVGLVLLPR